MPDTTSRPQTPSIGLCFSGGGFRAALYAVGVARYLAEAGLLPRVRAISAVSGGSIAAALLADRWPDLRAAGFAPATFIHTIEEPFRIALAERNLRNDAVRNWVLRRATLRGRTRGSAVGAVLVDRLLRARQVVNLDPALQVILTSTDLGTGRAFRVSRDFIGSYDFGYAAPPAHLGLGTVVAASAAAPLLFPPVYLPTEGLGLKDPPRVLSLVDGGVYDNLGLEWFQGWDSGRPQQGRPVELYDHRQRIRAAQQARCHAPRSQGRQTQPRDPVLPDARRAAALAHGWTARRTRPRHLHRREQRPPELPDA